MRLKAAGYQVLAATSGEEALAQIAVTRPALVICDLRMPDMDGMALFDALHKTDPSLPMIMLTAHGSIPEAVDATQRGVFGFLTKPFDSKILLQQVEAALRMSSGTQTHETSEEDQSWRDNIVTRSPQMENLLGQAKLMAVSDASVFIQGDSGTGKELLARAIHQASPRHGKPFVATIAAPCRKHCSNPSCSAIPREHLPAPYVITRACSRAQKAARCFSTRSAICLYRFR